MNNSKKKIGIIFGTRPEIIKLAPVIWACQDLQQPFFCVHSGQHFSREMDQVFFEALQIPAANYKLNIGEKKIQGHGSTTGVMMSEIESILLNERPDFVIVQGDTNTALAGALVAAKIPEDSNGFRIKVAHVEAGLRSYDRRMPEEINRIIIDHISDFLFTPTELQKRILLSEGINEGQIHITGNTIVDTANRMIRGLDLSSGILKELNLQRGEYTLLTLHRQENVDNKEILSSVIKAIEHIGEVSSRPVIFPIHPRTEKRLKEFGIKINPRITIIKPVDYIDFLMLEANAKIILTDSGGVQEEACIFKVPCVTLRDSTERPETVDVGANFISGTSTKNILEGYDSMLKKSTIWANPFGDGNAAKRLIDILVSDSL